MIFHVAERDRWAAALETGQYAESTRGRSLAEEGFIHLSTREQVAGVLDRFYVGVSDLVLLHVDETRLPSPLRWEGGFPHLYGPLPVDAVVAVEPLR